MKEKETSEAKIAALEKENQALRERIAELERHLGIDSQTSSKPPSSDGLKKKKVHRTRSLREKKKGVKEGEKRHKGQTLKQVLEPNKIVKHLVANFCAGCGWDVSQEKVVSVLKRQVFDIPKPQLEVTEHQVEVKQCPQCQKKIQGNFPKQVKAPVQYGMRIKAVSAYLQHQQFIPEDRLSQVLKDLYDCPMSTGTIANISKSLGKKIESLVAKIADSVKAAPVKHLDETGFRIAGKTQWLHVVSTATATWYRPAAKRKDLKPLEGIQGRVIHDHWKSYFKIEGVSHGLCNAHHLRELKALAEIEQEPWATSMKKLLNLANNYRNRYSKNIPQVILIRLNKLYESILNRGLDFHESLPPLVRKGNRGRVKRRVGHNLLLRLKDYASDVLRFLTEADVPFTNNQAERDLRMMKCKQKISGCFRSFDNALDFANIRSFLSTARKQNFNLFDILIQALSDQLPTFSS